VHRRLPLRARLVAGFVVVMLVVLTAAASFVFWRVQVALDHRLDDDLDAQVQELRDAVEAHPGDPAAALQSLPRGSALDQVVDRRTGRALAASPAVAGRLLFTGHDLTRAARGPVQRDLGNLLLDEDRRLRVRTVPLDDRLVGVTALSLGQRDETLRELLAQLTTANLSALLLTAIVGDRLARAALRPVERYRDQADRVAGGETGVRLDVPAGADDEVTRLGHTLNRMLTAQEAAAQRERRFLADASHELRTPLTLLSSRVELALRRSRSATDYEQTLRSVGQDSVRLVRLADQLLDLERALHPTAPALGDAAAALSRAAQGAHAAVQDSPRTILAHPTPTPPAPVAVSDTGLDQLLGNLIDNAVRHGAGDIALGLRSSAGFVVLTVHDDGPGPPSDFLPHAIERFRRADEARTGPGSGLGLSVVHALVVAAGGELRLCRDARHHRYPPDTDGTPPCDHSEHGTTVSAVLPEQPARLTPGKPAAPSDSGPP
jgi:two-component system OmpR family sensor kinase